MEYDFRLSNRLGHKQAHQGNLQGLDAQRETQHARIMQVPVII